MKHFPWQKSFALSMLMLKYQLWNVLCEVKRKSWSYSHWHFAYAFSICFSPFYCYYRSWFKNYLCLRSMTIVMHKLELENAFSSLIWNSNTQSFIQCEISNGTWKKYRKNTYSNKNTIVWFIFVYIYSILSRLLQNVHSVTLG